MQNNISGRRDRLDPKAATTTIAHVEENRGHRAETNPVDEAIPVEAKEILSDVVTEAKKTVFGVITDCLKLNIRKEPKIDADVLTIIPALSRVQVDTEASTDEFYKVCTETGIEGFCMKKYVAIHK